MERVLVVDDDRGVKRGVSMMLRHEGYQVDEASDGQEALDLLSRVVYNLVITDLYMPRLGGIELLSWVRAHAPNTQCLVMTSHPDSDVMLRARKLTRGNVLSKPFSLAAMETAIKHLLMGSDDLLN
ncbi:MAG: response regulator [Candidatus Schekmanbacteria bacterium]|nr:response regulator [Candidatus Schekmanbacteria bacterium]